MRRIKLILAATLAMATLLAMAAAPAVANHWQDRWDDQDRWDGGRPLSSVNWNDWRGLAGAELDDCFWWRGDIFCEVDL